MFSSQSMKGQLPALGVTANIISTGSLGIRQHQYQGPGCQPQVGPQAGALCNAVIQNHRYPHPAVPPQFHSDPGACLLATVKPLCGQSWPYRYLQTILGSDSLIERGGVIPSPQPASHSFSEPASSLFWFWLASAKEHILATKIQSPKGTQNQSDHCKPV